MLVCPGTSLPTGFPVKVLTTIRVCLEAMCLQADTAQRSISHFRRSNCFTIFPKVYSIHATLFMQLLVDFFLFLHGSHRRRSLQSVDML